MRYYIIAGEASGDLYGARIIQEINSIDSNSEIRFWGGDKMISSGGTLVKHIKSLAFMGFYEVLKNLRSILNNLSLCKKDILSFNPDRIIYIDYPGFNLRISNWAKKKGFKNFYYISPQIWAWKESRIKIIKKSVDKLFVIFPFEKDYYLKKHNMETEYYGHPLIENINSFEPNSNFLSDNNIPNNKPIISLLPGSRKQEIKSMLPIFISLANNFDKYTFVIAGVNNINIEYYNQFLKEGIYIVFNSTYDLLSNSFASIVTSGTASLECSLFNIPQVVCYKTSLLSFLIGKIFVKLKYISLVNIILNKGVVKELIQNELNEKNILDEFISITNTDTRKRIKEDYSKIYNILKRDNTSFKIVNSIVSFK